MIHIRIDNNERNSSALFACGIKGVENLPDGDIYYFEGETCALYKADCPGCNPDGPREYGTPLSEMTGEEFRRIASSWGYP